MSTEYAPYVQAAAKLALLRRGDVRASPTVTLPPRIIPTGPTGNGLPRLAPPLPAESDLEAFRATAAGMGIDLLPWQETAARYITAIGPNGRLLYREVCLVVARQNGKTTLMKPLIVSALRRGKRIMHIAQNRELPRHMFGVIADALSSEPDLFPVRRGRVIWPRYGSGQEEITLENGGSYRIAAANRGGGRGWSNDLVIVDELREMLDHEVIAAVGPTMTMSPDPQLIELSNAGSEDSVVLNSVRGRRDEDPRLAYLEWSAGPDRRADDIDGWAEANPALGYYPSVLETLRDDYLKSRLANTPSLFETEHLCRWVVSMRPPVIDPATWSRCHQPVGRMLRPWMAVNMDPSGKRASAAAAWQQSDGTVALRIMGDVNGNPIDVERLGPEWAKVALRAGAMEVAFDPWTDSDLARHFRHARPVNGREYANASENFARLTESGRLRWDDADQVTADLPWTSRKPHESGAWMAVRAEETQPVTAALAAVRAVWLASGPRVSAPQIY